MHRHQWRRDVYGGDFPQTLQQNLWGNAGDSGGQQCQGVRIRTCSVTEQAAQEGERRWHGRDQVNSWREPAEPSAGGPGKRGAQDDAPQAWRMHRG
ncbi:hypothetical protein CDN98_10700 [Roseateles terrae]|nr:hypothetical protein CDN98_10700 [Roseateles terrae]